jgi:hypothetical protein
MVESRIPICVGDLHSYIARKNRVVAALCMAIVVTALLVVTRPPRMPKPVTPLRPCLQVPHPLSSLPLGFVFGRMWTWGGRCEVPEDHIVVFFETLDYIRLKIRVDTCRGFLGR